MHLIHRKTCRVCGSDALTKVIDLGEQYLQGSFVKPGKETPASRRIPATLVRCDPTRDEHACGLLQMEHTVPHEVIVDRVFKTTFARGLSYGPSKGLSKNDRIKETQGAYG